MMAFCILEAAWRKPVQKLVLFLRMFWGGSCAIWDMGVMHLKILSILKDVSLKNNTLAGKRGSVSHFSIFHCAKSKRGT